MDTLGGLYCRETHFVGILKYISAQFHSKCRYLRLWLPLLERLFFWDFADFSNLWVPGYSCERKLMTHDELIEFAKAQAKHFEVPIEGIQITVDMFPKIRVVETVVVYFESDEHDGKIEVCLSRETGNFISSTMTPRGVQGIKPRLQPAIPVLRIFDYKMAKAFYVDWLGFKVDWEHRTDGGGPWCLEVSRGAAVLHLTEHYGDGSPGVKVYIKTDDVEAYHRELQSRPNPNMRPGIEEESWGEKSMCVIDPFGNRIYFSEKVLK
jgi:catechol 2,3-dioxygenase-like lactoylglutathione lyase family enzyme